MPESYLHQVLAAAVAGVLSVVAASGAPGAGRDPAGAGTADPTSAASSRPPDPASSRPPDPAGPVHGDLAGRDISWPNCPVGQGIASRRTLGLPLPPPGTDFVVIGLTNGPGFFANPCLREQVAHARRLGLWASAYAVVTYPTSEELRRHGTRGPRDPQDRLDRLWNTGWAQATANARRMRAAGLDPPLVWVDVEPVRAPFPWSGDLLANRYVVEGALAGYQRAGLRVGVYSTPYLWRSVVGAARYRLPEWRTAGPRTRAAALGLCRQGSVQGGPAVLVQWYDDRVDRNALCPGRPAGEVLGDYFTRL